MEEVIAALQETLEKALNPSPWQMLYVKKKRGKYMPHRFQAHIAPAPEIENFYASPHAVILVVSREYEQPERTAQVCADRNEAIVEAMRQYEAWLEQHEAQLEAL